MKRLILLILFAGIVPATAAADEYQLLRFRATWCQPCLQQKGIFAEGKIATTMRKLKVKDVYLDVDKNPKATSNWKVKSIPCTILVKVNARNQATVIRRWNPVAGKAIMGAATYRSFVDPSKELEVPSGRQSNNVTKRAEQVAAYWARQQQFQFFQPRRRVTQQC